MPLRKDIGQSIWLYNQLRPWFPADCIEAGTGDQRNVTFSCPFCMEAVNSHRRNAKRGTYYVYSQRYWCFRCGTSMSGLDLLSKLSHCDVKDILPKYLEFSFSKASSARGMNLSNFSSFSPTSEISSSGFFDDEAFEIERTPLPDTLKHPLTERGKSYLEGRKVFEAPNLDPNGKFFSSEMTVEDPITHVKATHEQISIPWYYDGSEWYYQRRFLDNVEGYPKYVFPSNTKKKIYGLDMVDTSFPFIICVEGVFDSIWLRNGVAIGGKTMSSYQKWVIQSRFPRHRIVYAFDNDKPGMDAMRKLAKADGKILFLYWKDVSSGNKDLNEFAVNVDTKFFYNPSNIESKLMNGITFLLTTGNQNG
jgi:hypothetical protein